MENVLIRIGSVGASLLLTLISGPPTTVPAPSPSQSERILHLEDALLAPCCYRQPVRVHMSDAAVEMRDEIVGMVLSGQSDREILDHYKELYGPRILVEPEGKTRTALYSFPFMSTVAGVLLVMFFLRQWVFKRSELRTSNHFSSEALEQYRAKVRAAVRDY